MLQIKDVRKQYKTGDLVQTALDGVSLNLREQELVAILGPSGSGKSTLLNVIGGLDQYDSGDLIINGVSTKKYTDRDWDSYRNHTIGFIFQSYNLIPHQTVLANVELALTISGISASERKKRAIKALEDVGLGNQLHKRPNQMSGGQMQRVAIARALVNNPSILLADEPTGALDSETSIQVMELLKEVAKDRLVVMVTHNPELAYQYATRIVKVRDGHILDDSDPYEVDEAAMEPPKHRNLGKASMNFRSALMLSFNNLRTKKGRTLLTSFAGSIGIIGIALILSLSTGFQQYIDQIQENTLANYPLTIQSESADMTGAFATMMMASMGGEDGQEGTVEEQPLLAKMFTHIGSNDLAAFKSHLEDNYDSIGHTLNAVQYGYGVKPRVYADNPEEPLQVNPATLFKKITGNDTISALMDSDAFQEILDNPQLLDSQYQVLDGRWPEAYNELVVVLPSPTRLPDHIAYTLGLKDMSVLDELVRQATEGEPIVLPKEVDQWTYEDLMNLTFRLVPASDLYRYNDEYGVWEDMSSDEAFLADAIRSGEQLKVVGIVCPKDGSSSAALYPGIGYHRDLTQHIIDDAASSEIVQAQLDDRTVDVFSGKPFDGDDESTGLNFQDMISVDTQAISDSFGMDISEAGFADLVQTALEEIAGAMNVDTGPARQEFISTLANFSRNMLRDYHDAHADANGVARITLADVEPMVDSFLSSEDAQNTLWQMARTYSVPEDVFCQVYKPLLVGMVTAHIAQDISSEILPEISQPPTLETTPETEPQASDPTEEVPDETTLPDNSVPDETGNAVPDETTDSVPSVPDEISDPTPSVPDGTAEAPVLMHSLPSAPSDVPTDPSIPDETVPDETVVPPITPDSLYTDLTADQIEGIVARFVADPIVSETAEVMAGKMMEATVMDSMVNRLSGLDQKLAALIGSSIRVDGNKLAGAFHFNMDEAELRRLFEAMSGQLQERTAQSNLKALGYADLNIPTKMAIYMKDFAGKEEFLNFLDDYNRSMLEADQEEQIIQYTDMTGNMMASVKTIIDAVSYVLIAFVGVSLVVSSIMIGIITYISVMERTKEIGILRAMGASKHNISQVFNAETFIIGLCSGVLGIGITLLLLIPGNNIIHSLMGSSLITARLPITGAVVLILLSMGLTLLGGLIPSKQASRKDPVIALRSE